jgi:hypothetical protein
MTRGYRFNMRMSPEVEERLSLLKERAGRSASDVIHTLIMSTPPEAVTSGIPAPTQLTGGSLAETEVLRERDSSVA